MTGTAFQKLTSFLKQLDRARIGYTLGSQRDDVIMVMAAVPGERWEVEFFEDGSVEVERSISAGEICDESVLEGLLARHAEPSGHGAL